MKKIMFNEHYGLETAVLERRKTKTRRIIKVPDTWHGIDVCGIGPDIDGQSLLLYDADGYLIEDPKTRLCGQIMPKYKVGEIVAVAQKYKDIMPCLADSFHQPSPNYLMDKPGYNNKMYVRADLMPHQILITDCHCKLLQDISDKDCLREGISFVNGHFYVGYRKTTGQYIWLDGDTPREAFATLINKTSGKHTWEDNPYTFVYEFELIK